MPESSPVNVTLLQITPPWELAGNVQRIATPARDAHARGAQVIGTPELTLPEYAGENLMSCHLFCMPATRWPIGHRARPICKACMWCRAEGSDDVRTQ